MASISHDSSPTENLVLNNAVTLNDVKQIRKLLNKNRRLLEESDATNTTPLMLAAKTGNKEAFDELLRLGADVKATNVRGVSVLSMAVYGRNLAIVNKLLKSNIVVKSAKDGDLPPLCVAAMLGNVEIVKRLLKAGLAGSVGKGGMTPLMFAAVYNHFEVMAILKKHGEDIDQRNIAGLTALDMLKQDVPDRHLENKENINAEPKENINVEQVFMQSSIHKRRNITIPKIILTEVSKPVKTTPKYNSANVLTSEKQFRFSPYSGSHQENNMKIAIIGNRGRKNNIRANLEPAYLQRSPYSAPPTLSPNVAIFFGNISKSNGFSFSPLPAKPYSPLISPIEFVEPHTSTQYYGSPPIRDDDYERNIYKDNIADQRINPQDLEDGNHSFGKLVEILNQYNLGAFADMFIRQEIDYATFVTLSDWDLQQIGVTYVGHRQQMLALINRCQLSC